MFCIEVKGIMTDEKKFGKKKKELVSMTVMGPFHLRLFYDDSIAVLRPWHTLRKA